MNTTNRLPGPSTLENSIVPDTRPVSVLLTGKAQTRLAGAADNSAEPTRLTAR